MAAILLSDFVWEGTNSERLTAPNVQAQKRDGHIFKELDTGESYIHRSGGWHFINLGLSFIKATKSGSITTDSAGYYHVTFVTPLIDIDYGVELTCLYPGEKTARTAYAENLAVDGFDILVRDGKGHPIANAEVIFWLATRHYNP